MNDMNEDTVHPVLRRRNIALLMFLGAFVSILSLIAAFFYGAFSTLPQGAFQDAPRRFASLAPFWAIASFFGYAPLLVSVRTLPPVAKALAVIHVAAVIGVGFVLFFRLLDLPGLSASLVWAAVLVSTAVATLVTAKR
jgi:hypothetical protein